MLVLESDRVADMPPRLSGVSQPHYCATSLTFFHARLKITRIARRVNETEIVWKRTCLRILEVLIDRIGHKEKRGACVREVGKMVRYALEPFPRLLRIGWLLNGEEGDSPVTEAR